MNPKKKTILVEYWDCGKETHRHKVEHLAKLCMERNANRKPSTPREAYHSRYIQAAREVVNGASCRAAGELIGVSGERARDIVSKVLRMALRHCEIESMPCGISIHEVRQHKDYWLDKIDKVAAHWGV